jgi:hypothetical protein
MKTTHLPLFFLENDIFLVRLQTEETKVMELTDAHPLKIIHCRTNSQIPTVPTVPKK